MDPAVDLAVDVSELQDGGVVKVVKRSGPDPEDKPWPRDKVRVHYTGTLEDGTKFDSSRDRGEPFVFTLGKGEVIKGWDQGVASMVKGELAVFTIQSRYGYGEAGSPPKIPGGAILVFEVELLGFEGEDITKVKDGGIMRRIIKAGEGFEHPNDGASVTVDLVGKWNKVEFDRRESVSFILGEGLESKIPRGLELAVEKMKRFEEAQISLSPAYGFKNLRPFEEVPENAALVYKVKLKEFERAKESWQMEGRQKLEQSRILKDRGTTFFKEGKVQLASNKYSKIVDMLEHEVSLKGEEEDERQELIKAGLLNLALCKLKEGDWIEARVLCTKVIEESPSNEKAYFRRGEALLHLADYDLAKEDFARVVQLDPDNKAAAKKIAVCVKHIKEQKDKDKKLFANMFDKFALQDEKKANKAQSATGNLEINEWGGDSSNN